MPVHLSVFCDSATSTGKGLGRQTMPQALQYSAVMAICILWLAAHAGWAGFRSSNPMLLRVHWTSPNRGISWVTFAWVTHVVMMIGWRTCALVGKNATAARKRFLSANRPAGNKQFRDQITESKSDALNCDRLDGGN
jgi:hypothetical protein